MIFKKKLGINASGCKKKLTTYASGWYINVNTTVCYKLFYIWNECTKYSLKAYTTPKSASNAQGSFIADLNDQGPENSPTSYHFLRLDEDFAVVYFCRMLNESMLEMAFVLSR